ncbi:MAG: fibronectin type III domain-containing protein, partial [Patescibacteria group bacterium]|nr:fibronectin type III domain-containing protein [Patescibacteria group bacterium]
MLIIFILSLSIFSVQNSKSAEESQVNVDAYVDAETSGIGGGASFVPDNTPPVVYDISVSEVTTNSAIVSWKTNENSSAYLYYGKTFSYEMGVLQDHQESITFFHEIEINGLAEGTKYYFQLRSSDSAGNQSIKDGYEFETLSEIQIISDVSS